MRGGSTFPARCSVGVMDPSPGGTASFEAEDLLRPYVHGERGGKLRSQLAALHRDTSMETIEEAIQAACDLFVDKAEGISAPGQVYTWVRTTAHRILNREEDQRLRELPVDPTHTSLSEVAAKKPRSRRKGESPRTSSPTMATSTLRRWGKRAAVASMSSMAPPSTLASCANFSRCFWLTQRAPTGLPRRSSELVASRPRLRGSPESYARRLRAFSLPRARRTGPRSPTS